MNKNLSKKLEKNVYFEKRNGAFRFTVAVYPLARETGTFSSIEEGAAWARRRRLGLLESKATKSTESAGMHPGAPTPSLSPLYLPALPEKPLTRPTLDPGEILLADVLTVFETTKLDKLAGREAEASRVRRLQGWFGNLSLAGLDENTLDEWMTRRLEGLLGSGRNPNRGGEGVTISKHLRYRAKKRGDALPPPAIFPVSTQTVRHELVLLRRAVKGYFKSKKLMQAHGMWLQSHALMHVELPAKADPRDRRLSDDEVARVLGQLKAPRLRGAVLLALLTSLRCSELVSLDWSDVDMHRRVVRLQRPGYVAGKRTKIRPRDVPLLPGAVKLLEDAGQKERGRIFSVTASCLSQAWRRAADRAGLPDARLHDCRREAISRLIEKCGLSLHTVVLFSGHSDLNTLQRHYVRLNPSLIATELAASASASAAGFLPIPCGIAMPSR